MIRRYKPHAVKHTGCNVDKCTYTFQLAAGSLMMAASAWLLQPDTGLMRKAGSTSRHWRRADIHPAIDDVVPVARSRRESRASPETSARRSSPARTRRGRRRPAYLAGPRAATRRGHRCSPEYNNVINGPSSRIHQPGFLHRAEHQRQQSIHRRTSDDGRSAPTSEPAVCDSASADTITNKRAFL